MKKYFNIGIFLLLTACGTKTFSTTVVQQNPARLPVSHDYVRESAKATIAIGDMDLGDYKLLNRAWFTVISKDRIRFYVTLAHKQDDYSNPCAWNSTIFIDGKEFQVPCEKASNSHVTYMWDEIALPAVKTAGGDMIITSPYPKYLTTLQSLTIYIGKGYFDIYLKNISDDMQNAELILEHKGLRLTFKWHFVE